jgi:hypothetical protein
MTSAPTPGPGVFDELSAMVTMPVIGLTICPGFLLCIPGIAFAIVPVVVLGLVVLAAGVVIAAAVLPLLVASAGLRRGGFAVRALLAPAEASHPAAIR